MLQPDSVSVTEKLINIDNIHIDNIQIIENDIDYFDTISLVFLLYDIPDTALQQLIIHQRTKDIGTSSQMLIYKWALDQQACPTWKYKLLEGLVICQLNHIIRKFGFDVNNVKKHYQADNLHISVHINPFKKVLYKLCDNIETNTLIKLKKTLTTFENMKNISSYETCELVILDLLCQNFISFQKFPSRMNTAEHMSVKKLTSVLGNFPELKEYAKVLNEVEKRYNTTVAKHDKELLNLVTSEIKTLPKKEPESDEDTEDMENELWKVLEGMDLNMDGLRSDGKETGVYPIINKNRLGLCYIINQEEFYLSEASILANESALQAREGSYKDKNLLERTMKKLNFDVKTDDNVPANQILINLKHIVRNEVLQDDSIFVLCILSHGIKGHIYGADTVKVDVEKIKQIIDSDEAKNLHNKPKLMIIQACQTFSNPSTKKSAYLIPDAPLEHHIKKSDFLVFWATASGYKSYRYLDKGSIFISILCKFLQDKADTEHLKDIFTIVNRNVKAVFTKFNQVLNQIQISSIETDTWTKKFYLNK